MKTITKKSTGSISVHVGSRNLHLQFVLISKSFDDALAGDGTRPSDQHMIGATHSVPLDAVKFTLRVRRNLGRVLICLDQCESLLIHK
jgi:hypothetical protein